MSALPVTSAGATTGTWKPDFQCPRCRARLEISPACEPIRCRACAFQLRDEEGIWRAIPEERLSRYQQFIADYEFIRNAEGRGSADPAYYLELPYRDLTGRNQQQWEIRAKTFDCFASRVLASFESSSRILDLGAGNGWFSARMVRAGHEPVALDLLINAEDGLGAASKYMRQLPRPFVRVQAALDALPFADGQFDLAMFNASFHYSESYVDTLSEAIRCLRPGGTVAICDTPWYSHEDAGMQMVQERRTHFLERFGFESAHLDSREFLTDERLDALAQRFAIKWQVATPRYGVAWAMRPVIARLKGRREPSRFRIYFARVAQ